MCISCGKILSSIGIGNRHVREIHRPNQKAQCRICKKVYKNERSRNVHYQREHGVSSKQMDNVIKVPDTMPMYHGNVNDEYYE